MDNVTKHIYNLAKERSESNLMICAIEEMSELTKVFTKYLRGDDKFTRDSMIEEMAHVLLMVEVVQCKFSVSDLNINIHQMEVFERIRINTILEKTLNMPKDAWDVYLRKSAEEKSK